MDTSTLVIGGLVAVVLAYVVITSIAGMIFRALLGVMIAAAIGGSGYGIKSLFSDEPRSCGRI